MITLISSVITLATIANPKSVGPPCQSPPSDASKAVVDCYNFACVAYRANYNDCETPECKAQALVNYILALNLCGPVNRISESGWITIWVDEAGYGFTYDNTIPEGATAFEF